MWLSLDNHKETHTTDYLNLQAVKSEANWQQLFDHRKKVEVAFGVTDQNLLDKFDKDMQNKSIKLDGKWFLAYHNNKQVGAIGYIPFMFEGNKIARLQDVDILPKHQGKGFGNMLLKSILYHLTQKGFGSVCLMAKTDDWPKDWYLKNGFTKCGTYIRS